MHSAANANLNDAFHWIDKSDDWVSDHRSSHVYRRSKSLLKARTQASLWPMSSFRAVEFPLASSTNGVRFTPSESLRLRYTLMFSSVQSSNTWSLLYSIIRNEGETRKNTSTYVIIHDTVVKNSVFSYLPTVVNEHGTERAMGEEMDAIS